MEQLILQTFPAFKDVSVSRRILKFWKTKIRQEREQSEENENLWLNLQIFLWISWESSCRSSQVLQKAGNNPNLWPQNLSLNEFSTCCYIVTCFLSFFNLPLETKELLMFYVNSKFIPTKFSRRKEEKVLKQLNI